MTAKAPEGMRSPALLAARWAALAVIGGSFVLRVAQVRRHAFNPDEFQHLHGAWSIASGLVPYRDYFEHHTPWLPYFLAPFLSLFSVETDPGSAVAFVFFARAWMVVFSALALLMTYRLGRLWAGAAVAWTGAVLIGTVVMFLDITLEIRPDVPAVAFLLGSWVAWLMALRYEETDSGSRSLFFRSGFLLGAAILCTQKALFTLPASSLLWLLWLFGPGGQMRGRAKHLLFFILGGLVPLASVLSIFAVEGALRIFVQFNLLTNLGWAAHFSPTPILLQVFHENALVVTLGLAGLVLGIAGVFRKEGRGVGVLLIPAQTLGLAAGLLVMPVPYAQYLVPALPLLALMAAKVLVDLVEATRRWRRPRLRIAFVTALVTGALALSLAPAQNMLLRLRPSHTKHEDALNGLRFVVARTSPSASIFDGFSGLGVFRPHAFFYFFLHDEMRLLLQGEGLDRLFAQLRDGVVSPDWVAMDEDVRALPSKIVAFLEANYEPAPLGPLWRLKDAGLEDGRWLDLGNGAAARLTGRGWAAPEEDEGRTFRKGLGPRTTIRLPMKRPGLCHALRILVRPGSATSRATLDVSVNGSPLGLVELQDGWREYALSLPPAALRAGVNSLQLIYEPGPTPTDPWSGESDGALSVSGLKLECGSSSGERQSS